ncbi:toll/interleukin-1 receptor domain-containing protein [Demequina aurantiaca]|uniref:toll/interleukin-1 receptor domain-containing protein n=1 Tax=Demequina aurantiaca TaxID=676200 RepID=UPI00078135D7|nr:toll/interleukin-1 receptor domain-containing protein [Demequina aurantiaca]
MSADLFVSYAWTSVKHREWVHLLAAQLKALGFNVLLDADVDYGEDLNGFMRRVTDSRRVLLIMDENYVERANTLPESGVGKENRWIAEAFETHEPSWLTALFVDNPNCLLPDWIGSRLPRGFVFNYAPASLQQFPGSEQIEDLWRWVAGLPANRDSATSIATLRERATRLDHQAARTEPSQWRSPELTGEIQFSYDDAPQKTFRWGFGVSEFALHVSGCGNDSVYVYRDTVKAVGLVRSATTDDGALEEHLVPGRTVTPRIGERVVLMNEHGRLAVVEILDVQRESTDVLYIAPYVTFRWRVIESS